MGIPGVEYYSFFFFFTRQKSNSKEHAEKTANIEKRQKHIQNQRLTYTHTQTHAGGTRTCQQKVKRKKEKGGRGIDYLS